MPVNPPMKFATSASDYPWMLRPNLLCREWFDDPMYEGLPLTPTRTMAYKEDRA